MSRSRKKCFWTISKKMAENVHSVVRRKVKEALHKMDVTDPEDKEYLISEADTKELDLEDYGTKIGLEFVNLKEFNNFFEEDLKEGRRK